MRSKLDLAAMLLTLAFVAGCAGVLYVQTAPPPLEVEIRTPPPSDIAVWIDGYWAWRGDNYHWVSGFWETHPRGAWVPGQWEGHERGYHWVKGHWNRQPGNRDRHDHVRGDHGDHGQGTD
jgi:hypothetical protein